MSDIIRKAASEYTPQTQPSRAKPGSPGLNQSRNTEVAVSPSPLRETAPAVKKRRSPRSIFKKIVIAIILAIVGTICTVVLTTALIVNIVDLRAFHAKHNSLLELAEALESEREMAPFLSQLPYTNIPPAQSSPAPQYISAFDVGMRDINPDYICWIKIEDTKIDYPVVRGEDNEKYLNLSFFNERNGLGALFMDYRCEGEYVPHIIIYGHNARSGDLFGGLRRFLNERYLEEHPTISLKVNDRIVEYEIFSARETDVADIAYDLDFSAPGSFSEFAENCGAPPDTAQIITLSTCVSGYNKDERVIVQGAFCQ